MLRIEPRECKKCHKLYTWTGGGIVQRIDLFDGLCPECKEKEKGWLASLAEKDNGQLKGKKKQ